MIKLNKEVTHFLDVQNHPLRGEIEQLRYLVLSSNTSLTENIKWNGPNYCLNNEDRITMRIQPPKQVQLIFHCGAKVKQQPKERLIKNDFGILDWKSKDRAVVSFKNLKDIEDKRINLIHIINDWINEAR